MLHQLFQKGQAPRVEVLVCKAASKTINIHLYPHHFSPVLECYRTKLPLLGAQSHSPPKALEMLPETIKTN